MKKILCMMCLALLVGCIFDNDEKASSRKKMWWSVEVSGVAQRGFFMEAENNIIYIESLLQPDYTVEDGCQTSSVEGVMGDYTIKATLRDNFVMISTYSQEYVDTIKQRKTKDMNLNVVVDLDQMDTVNLNYLTTLAHELMLHYIRNGSSYEDARLKANAVVLKNFHMSTDLTDFEHYSLYGTGAGDAMLVAISYVIEQYYLKHSHEWGWKNLTIDTLTETFADSNATQVLSSIVAEIISNEALDSIRKALEAVSPTGKVAAFEKYLSPMYVDVPPCDAANQGWKNLFGRGHNSIIMVCSDSVWRRATKDDYGVKDIFNPNIEYGTLVDSRDGRTYKTVEIDGHVMMAENLKYADSAATENLKGQNWCYEDDESNCELFGRLYSWSAVMDFDPVYLDSYLDSFADVQSVWQGICPEGWHVPKDEFNKLPSAKSYASGFMTVETNSSGLSVIPAGYGYKYKGGTYNSSETIEYAEMGETTFLWTSEERRVDYAQAIYLDGKDLEGISENKHNAGYLRCVKDYEPKD